MTLIQTLSDNHQTKLNNNEQQIEQVKSFIFSFFVFLRDFSFSIEQKLNHFVGN